MLRRFCFAYLATVSSNSALFVAFWSETMASGERMLRLVERRRLRSGAWRAVARQGSNAARARMTGSTQQELAEPNLELRSKQNPEQKTTYMRGSGGHRVG